MHVKFLGTNTLLLTQGETSILVDPHFTRPGLFKLAFPLRPDPLRVAEGLREAGVSQVDALLLTHTHYDHAMDASLVAHQAGGMVYGSNSAAYVLEGSGTSRDCFHPVKAGESFRIGEVAVRFLPARHIAFPPPLRGLLPESSRIQAPLRPPAPFWAYRCGEVYALQVGDVLIFGSAGLMPGAYRGLLVKTVILGIGGLETKPGSYLEDLYSETVLASGAETVWLSHWDNFFRPLRQGLSPLGFSAESVRRLKALGKKHGQAVERLPFNQSIRL